MDTMVASRPAPAPISRVSLEPTIIWPSTSWPSWVVPSQCAADGGCHSDLVNMFGSWISSGPMIASSTKNATIAMPVYSRQDLVMSHLSGFAGR